MSVPHIQPAKGMRKFEFKQSKYKHLDGMCPLRNITSGNSGAGKGILLQSLILDVFRGGWDRVYVFSLTINSDHTWEPVLKYIRNELKVPEE